MTFNTPAHLRSLWRPESYLGTNFKVVEEVSGTENAFLIERTSTGRVYELFQYNITMSDLEFQEVAASVANGIVTEVRDLAAQEGDVSIGMLRDDDIDVPEEAVRGRIASGLLDATVPHHIIAGRLEQYFSQLHAHQQAGLLESNSSIPASSAVAAGGDGFSTVDPKMDGEASVFCGRPPPPPASLAGGPLTIEALLSGEGHGTDESNFFSQSATVPRSSPAVQQRQRRDRGGDAQVSSSTPIAPIVAEAPIKGSSSSSVCKMYCPIQRVIDSWVSEREESPVTRPASPTTSPSNAASPTPPNNDVSLVVNVVLEHVPYTLHALALLRSELSSHAPAHSRPPPEAAPWAAHEAKTIVQSVMFVTAALEDICAEGFIADQFGPTAVSASSLDYNTIGCRTDEELVVSQCKVRLDAFASIPILGGKLPPCVTDWEARYPRSIWDANHRDVVAVLYGLGHSPRPGSSRRSLSNASSRAGSPHNSNNATFLRRPQVSSHLVSRLNRFTVAMFLLDLLRMIPEADLDFVNYRPHIHQLSSTSSRALLHPITTNPDLGVTTATGRYHTPPSAPDGALHSRFISPSEFSGDVEVDDKRGHHRHHDPPQQDAVLMLLLKASMVSLLGHARPASQEGVGGGSSPPGSSPFDHLPLELLAKMLCLHSGAGSSGGRRKVISGTIPPAIEAQFRQFAQTIWRSCTDGSSVGGGSGSGGNSQGRGTITTLGGSSRFSSRPGTSASTVSKQHNHQPTPPLGGSITRLPSGSLQTPSSGRSSPRTHSGDGRRAVIGAAIGLEEIRHVFYCSSFDFDAHYGPDGGRRRRQFYEGYHDQRYPHGIIPRAPAAVWSVKPPTHTVTCSPSWSHDEAIANIARKRVATNAAIEDHNFHSSPPRRHTHYSPTQALSARTAVPPSRPTTAGSIGTYSSRLGTTTTTNASSRPLWSNEHFDEEYANAKREKKERNIDYSKRLKAGPREAKLSAALGSTLDIAKQVESGSSTTPRRHHHNNKPPAAAPLLPDIGVPPPPSATIKGTHNSFYPPRVAARLPTAAATPSSASSPTMNGRASPRKATATTKSKKNY